MNLTKVQNDWLVGQILKDFESFSQWDSDIIESLVSELDLDIGVWDKEYRYLIPSDQQD